ncbi:MAG: acyl-CoA dehydrogenase family protein [Chloroflexi bacterium]|nr:acyl-CoA dehydrogenase family protein [Chloroflexota bacterium]
MDFSLTDEQRELRHAIIEFAQRELGGDLIARDKQGIFSREHWRKCGEFGLLGLNAPREYGGQGKDALSTTLALEALGYACRDNGLTFAISAQLTSILPTITGFASAAQKERYVPRLCKGEMIACYGMTEPATGSDAFALATTATKREDGYLLNGEKTFITFAPLADLALIFATTNPQRGNWGISIFFVERGTRGFETSAVMDKMGLRTVPMGKLTLKDCFVPTENRLGPEGAGASMFNSSQEWERACILASEIGAMERQLDACIRFARARHAFGQPIGKFQAISNRVAEMKLRLETARLLTYKAAWLKQTNQSAMLDAALANLFVGESFAQSSLDAARIHGARGYVTEFEIERDLRDALGGPIYGGTSDIQRNIIARLLGL